MVVNSDRLMACFTRFADDHEQFVSGGQLKEQKLRYSFELHSDPWHKH